MAEAFHSNGLELLPTEILYGIVKCLDNRAIKRLSCISRRMRDVCLPSLFRKVSIEYSHVGFDVLENLLQSHLHQYIVTFQYVVPELLKPGESPVLWANHSRKRLIPNQRYGTMRFSKQKSSLLKIMSKYAKAMTTSMVVRIGTKWNISQETTLHIRASIRHYEGLVPSNKRS